MRVLFVTTPEKYASTRLRVLNYFPHLNKFEKRHIVGSPEWSFPKKVQFAIELVNKAMRSDIVFIHKLLMPPIITRTLAKINPIIYDYDDAVYLDRPWHNQSQDDLQDLLHPMLQSATSVITSTPQIQEYTRQYSNSVYQVPTTLPREKYSDIRQDVTKEDNPTIGWIGHPENLYYIKKNIEIVVELLNETRGKLRIITSKDRTDSPLIERDDVEYVEWTKETADYELGSCHCAIRPLEDHPWTQAKCHTSVIQPMALGVPVITSDVGILSRILSGDSGGFLPSSIKEWVSIVDRLLEDADHRKRMGHRAVERVDEIEYWTDNQANKIRDIILQTSTGVT